MQEYFSEYYKTISDNIKQLRVKLGLSQEKFAESIGCSREYISRLENYHEHASLDFILNISLLYKIQPENFFKKL